MTSAQSRSLPPDDFEAVACLLPGGYRDGHGAVHRDVVLAPPTGRIEEWLAAHTAAPLPVMVTALLEGCLLRLGDGPDGPVTTAMVRDLLVADRTYLLLQLHRMSYGDRCDLVLTCPACYRSMDVTLLIDQIPVVSRRPGGVSELLELSPGAVFTTPDGTHQREVRFRLPTGGDQEALAAAAENWSEAEAFAFLLGRCVTGVRSDAIPAVAVEEIEAAMERVSPSVDVDLDLTCPECSHTFVQAVDLTRLVLDEMRIGRDRLFREVHTLALCYHWSESEILRLTRPRRRTYLSLLSDAAHPAQSVGS